MSAPRAPAAARARLFVGLRLPPKLRAAVQEHTQHWSWPPAAALVRDDKLHLTLHFLGPVSRERIPELVEALAVPFDPFELRFDRGELWPGGIAVLRPVATPPELRALHQRLHRALERVGQPTARSRLKPHVTLARHAAGAVPPSQRDDLRWAVDGFSLFESDLRPPTGYRALADYP